MFSRRVVGGPREGVIESGMTEIDAIEHASDKIKRVASVLFYAFTIVFWVALVAQCAVAILMVINGATNYPSESASAALMGLLSFGVSAVVTLFMIWVLAKIFQDMSKGLSPFSLKQARRLRFASALQIIHAIYSTVASPAFLQVFGLDEMAIGATLGIASVEAGSRFIPINAGDIVLAIVLFCAALIVEYGSLLQKLSDDTL